MTADIDCDMCCKYPSLQFRFKQVNGDTTFSLGDTIVNNEGAKVKVLKLVYLLSDISIILDGAAASVEDTMRIKIAEDTVTIREDFVRVTRTKATYTVGKLRPNGHITELNFHLGIPPQVDGSILLNTVGNDLSTDPDSLRADDRTYAVQRLLLAVGESLTDTIIVDVPAAIGNESISIVLDTSTVVGMNKVLEITVDYGNWFDDIDFTVDDDEMIAKKLRANLARSFSN